MTGDEQKLAKSLRGGGRSHAFIRDIAASLRLLLDASNGTALLGRSVGPGLLRCASAAPRSSVGEVNLSPDDGQELPDLQLRGRAGSTSTDRRFLGLWPQHSRSQTKVTDAGEGGSSTEGNVGDGGPSAACREKCKGPCCCRELCRNWSNLGIWSELVKAPGCQWFLSRLLRCPTSVVVARSPCPELGRGRTWCKLQISLTSSGDEELKRVFTELCVGPQVLEVTSSQC